MQTLDAAPDYRRPSTPEPRWRAWTDDLPERQLRPARVLVVAPHPDDETLALGATLAGWAAVDVQVEVVTVTDGEGSHPGRVGLVDERATEQAAALTVLGVGGPAVRLGLPDGDVAHHEGALAARLAERCDRSTLVLAPWEHDGHTDHDASGRAAAAAARRSGSTFAAYPVWAWRWATPARLAAARLVRLPTSAGAQAAKEEAMGCYCSQLDPAAGPPIVPPDALDHFRRPYEVITEPRRA